MGLIIKNKMYGQIHLDTNKIIGIMGKNSSVVTDSLNRNMVSFVSKDYEFYTNSCMTELMIHLKKVNTSELTDLLKMFDLDEYFLKKKINDLSSGEKKILKYLSAFLENKKNIFIDEPFLDIDFKWKKCLISFFKRTIYEKNKTIFIVSNNSNIIYELCDMILLLEKEYVYGTVRDIFTNTMLLEKYHIDIPNIVEFVNLAKKKKVLIDYSYDIRDLIKDVYKHV